MYDADLAKLHCVQNTPAWVVARSIIYDHITQEVVYIASVPGQTALASGEGTSHFQTSVIHKTGLPPHLASLFPTTNQSDIFDHRWSIHWKPPQQGCKRVRVVGRAPVTVWDTFSDDERMRNRRNIEKTSENLPFNNAYKITWSQFRPDEYN